MPKLQTIAVLIGIGIAVFFGASRMQQRKKEKQVMEEFNQTRRDMVTEMKRDLDKDGVISADTAAKAMDKMRGQLDKLATQGGKEDKPMKATVEVMVEFQEKAAPYITLIKKIETDNPMDMMTVKDKADLATRRKLGQEMLRMNQDLVTFINSVESRFREKIQKSGGASGSNEEFVAGFMKGYRKTSGIQLRIRKTDETMAKAFIAMTDLLEAQWGKWKVKDTEIAFDDDATAARYNKLADEIGQAADEQAAAQRELIEVQQRK